MVKYMVSKIDRFIFFELNVQKGKYEGQKIKKDKTNFAVPIFNNGIVLNTINI